MPTDGGGETGPSGAVAGASASAEQGWHIRSGSPSGAARLRVDCRRVSSQGVASRCAVPLAYGSILGNFAFLIPAVGGAHGPFSCRSGSASTIGLFAVQITPNLR